VARKLGGGCRSNRTQHHGNGEERPRSKEAEAIDLQLTGHAPYFSPSISSVTSLASNVAG
jgi:hypothetical protein